VSWGCPPLVFNNNSTFKQTLQHPLSYHDTNKSGWQNQPWVLPKLLRQQTNKVQQTDKLSKQKQGTTYSRSWVLREQGTGTGNTWVTVVSGRPARPPEAKIATIFFRNVEHIGEHVCKIFVTFSRCLNLTESLDFTRTSIEDCQICNPRVNYSTNPYMWVVGGRLPRWSRSKINFCCRTTVFYPSSSSSMSSTVIIVPNSNYMFATCG